MRSDATPYLHYKIVECARDHFQDLGFLTTEDISEKILLSKFSSTDVNIAINTCAREKFLDVYYLTKCEECGSSLHYLEEDVESGSTRLALMKGELECYSCRAPQSRLGELQEVYAIPTIYLGEEPLEAEPASSQGVLGRLARLFKRG